MWGLHPALHANCLLLPPPPHPASLPTPLSLTHSPRIPNLIQLSYDSMPSPLWKNPFFCLEGNPARLATSRINFHYLNKSLFLRSGYILVALIFSLFSLLSKVGQLVEPGSCSARVFYCWTRKSVELPPTPSPYCTPSQLPPQSCEIFKTSIISLV